LAGADPGKWSNPVRSKNVGGRNTSLEFVGEKKFEITF